MGSVLRAGTSVHAAEITRTKQQEHHLFFVRGAVLYKKLLSFTAPAAKQEQHKHENNAAWVTCWAVLKPQGHNHAGSALMCMQYTTLHQLSRGCWVVAMIHVLPTLQHVGFEYASQVSGTACQITDGLRVTHMPRTDGCLAASHRPGARATAAGAGSAAAGVDALITFGDVMACSFRLYASHVANRSTSQHNWRKPTMARLSRYMREAFCSCINSVTAKPIMIP